MIKINLSVLFFIMGFTFIMIGYSQQLMPSCDKGAEVRIVSRNVYDEIIKDSVL